MTKIARPSAVIPTRVGERLRTWGACVRKQRIAQQMTAIDLCKRMQISHPTLQRLENGEATVSVALYLSAFHILGVLELAAPELPPEIWQLHNPAGRARTKPESDDDHF